MMLTRGAIMVAEPTAVCIAGPPQRREEFRGGDCVSRITSPQRKQGAGASIGEST
ncbi:MAG: hypothetical protein ACK5OB_11225 [Pirellula sp.]